jgi:hypothetical protein
MAEALSHPGKLSASSPSDGPMLEEWQGADPALPFRDRRSLADRRSGDDRAKRDARVQMISAADAASEGVGTDRAKAACIRGGVEPFYSHAPGSKPCKCCIDAADS